MPRVGSSRIRMSGSEMTHFASTTFCWLPPESVPTFTSMLLHLMWKSRRYSSTSLCSMLSFMMPCELIFSSDASEAFSRMFCNRFNP